MCRSICGMLRCLPHLPASLRMPSHLNFLDISSNYLQNLKKIYFIKPFLICGRKISVSGQRSSQNLGYIYFSVKLEAKSSVRNESGSVDGREKETAYFREHSLGKCRVLFCLFVFYLIGSEGIKQGSVIVLRIVAREGLKYRVLP